MNTPVRRVAIAVMVMILVLMGSLTYVQVGAATTEPTPATTASTGPVLTQAPPDQRGRQILASSTETDDRLRYLRRYRDGPTYAPVTALLLGRLSSSGIGGSRRTRAQRS